MIWDLDGNITRTVSDPGDIIVPRVIIRGQWGYVMATSWGVDSALAADKIVDSDNQTLFDLVRQQCGQEPAFWGRYIGGRYALTATEAQFLHNGGCKILVIYNGARDRSSSVQGGFQEGANDANKAIAAAQALGVPFGVWIYADVEAGWKPTSDWFQGWSDTMFNSQFGDAGGIYGDPHKTNAGNFNVPYCNAFNSDSSMQGTDDDAAYIFSSEPEPGCTTAAQAPPFAPDMPPCNPNTVIWQYAENCVGGRVDEDLANDAGFASMW